MQGCHTADGDHAHAKELRSTHHHDPVTSLQTFRDILEHGRQLSDTPPKHQTSQSVLEESDKV